MSSLRCIDVASAAGLEAGARRGAEQFYRCPCHDDQHPSLRINTEKNCWFCFPCGQGGGAWALAAFVTGKPVNDKRGVAAWLGQHGLFDNRDHSGLIRRPKRPLFTSRERAQEGLGLWAKIKGRRLRNEALTRNRIETAARDLLKENPDDRLGWAMLEFAYAGRDKTEHYLDLLDSRKTKDHLTAFRELK